MGSAKMAEQFKVPSTNSSALLSKRATYDPRIISPLNAGAGSASSLSSEHNIHPSIAAYQQAHPRRGLINFGPYILLQTLGEGEFGKVKLGVHKDYGEEVAVKLIRRGSVDSSTRLTKVEREIDVLKVWTAYFNPFSRLLMSSVSGCQTSEYCTLV
jgi:serine/threonine protein kinase